MGHGAAAVLPATEGEPPLAISAHSTGSSGAAAAAGTAVPTTNARCWISRHGQEWLPRSDASSEASARLASTQAAQHVQATGSDPTATASANRAAHRTAPPTVQQHHCGPRTTAVMIAAVMSLWNTEPPRESIISSWRTAGNWFGQRIHASFPSAAAFAASSSCSADGRHQHSAQANVPRDGIGPGCHGECVAVAGDTSAQGAAGQR